MRMKLRSCLVSSVSFVVQIGEFSSPIRLSLHKI
jgi:hypothetical protein